MQTKMELEEHLWTPSFWRWISCSTDDKRLKVLRKVILHKLGNAPELKDACRKLGSFAKTNSPKKKVNIKVVFPKGTLKNLDVQALKKSITTAICNSMENPPNVIPYTPESTPKKQIEDVQEIPKIRNNEQNAKVQPRSFSITSTTKNSGDSETVYKLVTDKFKSILHGHYQRSIRRSAYRKKFFCNTDLDEIENDLQEAEDKIKAKAQLEDQVNLKEVKNQPESVAENNLDKINEENLNQKAILTNNDTVNENTRTKLENLFEKTWSESNSECDDQSLSKVALGQDLDNKYSDIKIKKFNLPMFRAIAGSASHCDTRSIGTSDISTLLTKSQGRDTLSSAQTCEISQNISRLSETLHADTTESFLLQERERQYQTMVQASKVLDIYQSKAFRTRPEYLEVEKILLLATQKFETVQSKQRKMEYEHQEDILANVGQVQVSNLAFMQVEKNHHFDKFTRWYIALLSHDTTVMATDVVKADHSGVVRFPNVLKFQKLNINFNITISIYSLKVKNCRKTNQDTPTCPSPYKFLSFNRSPLKQEKKSTHDIHESSFVLCGTTTITRIDLTQSSLLKLSAVASSSNLRGTITMSLASTIEFSRHAGFLTTGSEVDENFTWNRRWVYLDRYILKVWNYPSESPGKQPIHSIDLSCCVTPYICQVDRRMCARPYTLMLETMRPTKLNDSNYSCKVTKHYLSADNADEMEAWEQLLNTVLCALRTWNCMKC